MQRPSILLLGTFNPFHKRHTVAGSQEKANYEGKDESSKFSHSAKIENLGEVFENNTMCFDYSARFKIVFEEQATNDIVEDFAYFSNGELISNGEGYLQVFDIL